MSRLF